MKPITQSLAFAAIILSIGCAQEEPDLNAVPPPAADSIVAGGNALQPVVPPTTQNGGLNISVGSTAPVAEAVPLVSDAEEKMELADYTEKVYLGWNAALNGYRKKHGRLPGNLLELQQFQPDLANLKPPRGFTMQFDVQNGEIYVTHVAPLRAAQRTTQAALPPPAIIR